MLKPALAQIPLQSEFLSQHGFADLDLHAPEFAHLLRLSEALIVTRGSKSIEALARANPQGRDPSCVSRFFNGTWDAGALLNAGRAVLSSCCEGSCKVVYHIVDDTANPHSPAHRKPSYAGKGKRAMQALDFHYDHNLHTTVIAHSVVTSHVVCGNWAMPWKQAIYRREEDCRRSNMEFRSKVDMAAEFIRTFQAPAGSSRVCHLVDSWYMNSTMMDAVAARGPGHLLVGAIKCNVVLDRGEQGRCSLAKLAEGLGEADIDSVTVGKVVYETKLLKGRIHGHEVALLITRRKGDTHWLFIACTDPALGTAEILQHYSQRWHIEVGHWYLKCTLGFGDYRLRRLDSIQRFWAISVFTYWYLEWLRHRIGVPNLADTERCYIKDYERREKVALWEQFRDCDTVEAVLARFNDRAA